MMITLFGVGLYKGLCGVYSIFPVWPGRASFTEGVETILKSIEILILAPLVYLVFATVSTYAASVHDFIVLKRHEQFSASQDQGERADAERRLHDCHELLQQVKQIVAGLFVALLLTDLISRIFRNEQFTLIGAGAEAVALGAAITFYFAVGLHAEKPTKRIH